MGLLVKAATLDFIYIMANPVLQIVQLASLKANQTAKHVIIHVKTALHMEIITVLLVKKALFFPLIPVKIIVPMAHLQTVLLIYAAQPVPKAHMVIPLLILVFLAVQLIILRMKLIIPVKYVPQIVLRVLEEMQMNA